MAEVQKSTQSGEAADLFIQFVMMQQQQALLAMGRHPHASPGSLPTNLKLAKIFIDQLSVIRMKTAGNLSPDETQVINSAIATLQAAYVDVTSSASSVLQSETGRASG